MSSSFGQWYQEQQAQENAPSSDVEAGGGDQMLPLWGDTSQYSFGSLRSSMEAQMPQKILGMNYQQRFRVSDDIIACSCVCVQARMEVLTRKGPHGESR